jgi:hypothetical protein
LFLALPENRIAVLAESYADAEHMVTALQKKDDAPWPKQWAELEKEHRKHAAVVILRRYDRTSEESSSHFGVLCFPPKAVGLETMGLWLEDVSSLTFSIVVRADNPAGTQGWFTSHFFPDAVYQWQHTLAESGFSGTIKCKDLNWVREYFSLQLIGLWGACVAI